MRGFSTICIVSVLLVSCGDSQTSGPAAVTTPTTLPLATYESVQAYPAISDNPGGVPLAIFRNKFVIGTNNAAPGVDDTVRLYPVTNITHALPAEPVPLQQFANPDPGTLNNFGFSAAYYGDTVAIGAPNTRDFTGTRSGAVHLFNADDGNLRWTIRRPPTPTPPFAAHGFGYSVALYGHYLVVGGRLDDAAFVFNAHNGQYLATFYAPKNPDSTTAVRSISAQVAIDRYSVIVGDWTHQGPDRPSPNLKNGVVYVFDAQTGNLRHTLPTPTDTESRGFGYRVAISGNVLAVSHLTHIESPQRVYLYDVQSGKLIRRIDDPNFQPGASNAFGAGLALSGNSLLVGSGGSDVAGTNVGIAHLFDAGTGALVQTFANPIPANSTGFGLSLGLQNDNVVITSAQGPVAARVYQPRCKSILNGAVRTVVRGQVTPTANMLSFFGANGGLTLAQAANECGYAGFNWYQRVASTPFKEGADAMFLDPPINAPAGHPDRPEACPKADSLPYYWDEEGLPGDHLCHISQHRLSGNIDQVIAQAPEGYLPALPGTSQTLHFLDPHSISAYEAGNPSHFTQFYSALVGINASQPTSFDLLYAWKWKSNLNLGNAQTPPFGGVFDIVTDVEAWELTLKLRNNASDDGLRKLPVAGDLDLNGCVELFDYEMISADASAPPPRNIAYDLNGDGDITAQDAAIVQTQYKNPAGQPCD